MEEEHFEWFWEREFQLRGVIQHVFISNCVFSVICMIMDAFYLLLFAKYNVFRFLPSNRLAVFLARQATHVE